MRFPTYLIRRGGVFYYRAKVPSDLLHQLNRREVWISLRTSDRKSAELRLADTHIRQLRTYECLRQGLHAPVELTLAPQKATKPVKSQLGASVDDLLVYWSGQEEKRPRTLLDAQTAVRRLKATLGDMPVTAIERRHPVDFKDALLTEGLAHPTTVKNLGLVTSIFDVACSTPFIGVNLF